MPLKAYLQVCIPCPVKPAIHAFMTCTLISESSCKCHYGNAAERRGLQGLGGGLERVCNFSALPYLLLKERVKWNPAVAARVIDAAKRQLGALGVSTWLLNLMPLNFFMIYKHFQGYNIN